MQEAGDPVPVLLQDRLVEVQLGPQRGQALRRRRAAEYGTCRVARQRLGGREDQDRDDCQHQQPEQGAAEDEAPDPAGMHASAPAVACSDYANQMVVYPLPNEVRLSVPLLGSKPCTFEEYASTRSLKNGMM